MWLASWRSSSCSAVATGTDHLRARQRRVLGPPASVAALIDIKRRPASQMRGRKRVWAAAVALIRSRRNPGDLVPLWSWARRSLVLFVVSFVYVRGCSAHTTQDRRPRSRTLLNRGVPRPTNVASVLGATPREFKSRILCHPDRGRPRPPYPGQSRRCMRLSHHAR